MYKTLVYTLVNLNIEELAYRKQQKLQKMILPASHWLCVNKSYVIKVTIDWHWVACTAYFVSSNYIFWWKVSIS